MIDADQFLTPALQLGFNFYTGVPCSFLKPLINRTISRADTDYVGATSEGEAVGIASGAWLAGCKTVVMCQNSGLGNMVNPLTSLNHPFRIPTLLIVTWRGEPGLKDEPQHEIMGEITHALLGTMRIPHRPFPKTVEEVAHALSAADDYMERTGLPFALVMEKNAVSPSALEDTAQSTRRAAATSDSSGQAQARPTRFDVLKLVQNRLRDTAVVATTGKTGRELFTLGDYSNQLYQVGSMGCASAMGFGIALRTNKRVVVVDGDGAALMKLGSFATIGSYAPQNLVHLVLDNGVHDSTGGQATVSTSVAFADVASACGYSTVHTTDSLDGLGKALDRSDTLAGPHLIHVRIAAGSISDLGRPTVKPDAVARRFRYFVMDND